MTNIKLVGNFVRVNKAMTNTYCKITIAIHIIVLADFLPYVVGSDDYNAAVIHCLNCLGNPRLNRCSYYIVQICPNVYTNLVDLNVLVFICNMRYMFISVVLCSFCCRHFILRVVEVFLMRLIPEIHDSGFKVQLERLRTLKFTHGKSSIPSFSAFRRRTMLHNKSDTV